MTMRLKRVEFSLHAQTAFVCPLPAAATNQMLSNGKQQRNGRGGGLIGKLSIEMWRRAP